MLQGCNRKDLANTLLISKDITEKYFSILKRAKGVSESYMEVLLKGSGRKTRSSRIKAIKCLMSNMEQDELTLLAGREGLYRNSYSTVLYAFMESLFKRFGQPACNLIPIAAEPNLELYFLGQTLETLFDYSLSNDESEDENDAKFCALAIRSAIKKFGLETVVNATTTHPEGEKLRQLIKYC